MGYLKVDKTEALVCFNEAILLYCDNGRFDVAARLERIVADEHFRNKHWEEASLHYRKAANFLAGEQMFDQSDNCLEQAGYCFIEMKEYRKASFTYTTIAEGCCASNLRYFNSRGFLMKALLCLIAVPIPLSLDAPTNLNRKEKEKYDEEFVIKMKEASATKYNEVYAKLVDFEKIDCLWRCSKEALFIDNIVSLRLNYDREKFANHIYYYNNVKPLDRQSVVMLKVMNDEFSLEVRRLENIKIKEKRDKERARIKKMKLDKQKKHLKELGVVEEAVVDDEDVEKELIEHEEAVRKRELAQGKVENEAGELLDVDAMEHQADVDNNDIEDDEEEEGGKDDNSSVATGDKPARRRRVKKGKGKE